MKILLNLIGEQPIPNLLPVIYLKPEKSIFLYTETTRKRAEQLNNLVSNSEIVEIFPYDFNKSFKKIESLFNKEDKFIANITGGTKVMSLALFQLALASNSEIVYFISENNRSSLYRYNLNSDNELDLTIEELPELITAEDYIKAHIPYFEKNVNSNNNRGNKFEEVICNILSENGFELIRNIKPKGEGNQLEIDAVIRLKGTNNVGIAEIKIGDSKMEGPKKGVDQLGLASQREYLGIYTKRFLITSRQLEKRIKELALAHKILIIDNLQTKRNSYELTEFSKRELIGRIKEKLS